MAVLRRALRSLSTFATVSNRCIVYAQNGDPTKVVKSLTFPTLPPPSPDTVNLRFLLSPINPADVNTIEGVYPEKPSLISNLSLNGLGSSEEPVYVGGTEGLAQVTQVGNGVQGLKEGDWVVMDKPQSGTWSTSRNVLSKDVLRLPASGLTEAHGATMTINPPTAYNMLNDFVDLKEGDWIIQNGANSAVGQLVIQLAKERGINTINFVRSRDDMTPLVKHLENLGATKVLTYEELSDKSLRGRVKEWTGGKDICLALNCVSGEPTTSMAKLLGPDAHLVSYGAMSKQPLSLPTSLHIFKNLTSHGFSQRNWYKKHSREEKERLISILAEMMKEGKIKPPEHTVVTLGAQMSDEEATAKIRNVFADLYQGKLGKKVLVKLEEQPL